MIAFKECWVLLLSEAAVLSLLVWIYRKTHDRWALYAACFCFFLLLLTLFFYRDPGRTAIVRPGWIMSPADGKIVSIEDSENPAGGSGNYTKISIYLSLFDVHMNRAPAKGEVVFRKYNPGRFYPAFLPKAADSNENLLLGIASGCGTVYVRQISGIVARRIVCHVFPGDSLQAGERYGMIKLGSRVELYVPGDPVVCVRTGDRVTAGRTLMVSYDTEE